MKHDNEPSSNGACEMLAGRLHGVRDLRLEKVPCPPVPGPDQVLLRVHTVSLCGSDIHWYLEGRIGDLAISQPLILGHEFSAAVEDGGKNCGALPRGQLVAVEPSISCGLCASCQQGHPNLCPHVRFLGTPPVDGALAQFVIMPAANCFPLPDSLGAVEGALLEPLGVALHSVDLAHMVMGQAVAVLGAGAIGLLTAAVARAAGASLVIMTDPVPRRRAFAASYVADEVLDPTAIGVVDSVLEFTGGQGVDVAFEAAGAHETPQQAAAMTRPGGRVIVAGIPVNDVMEMKASTPRVKGLTIKLVRRMKHTYPRAIRLVQKGTIDVKSLATHFFSPDRLEQAFDLAANREDGIIRAMIQMDR